MRWWTIQIRDASEALAAIGAPTDVAGLVALLDKDPEARGALNEMEAMALAELFAANECRDTNGGQVTECRYAQSDALARERITKTVNYQMTVPADPGRMGDPSFFQATVGYVFGDTSVALSWYQSSDFMYEGSEGTALGVGVNQNLPKLNANVYAAAQNYSVKMMEGADSVDDTVIMIGTRIKF